MSAVDVGRWAARAALVVLVLSALLWVRALAEARFELGRARQAAEAHDAPLEEAALARAVRWQAPLNFYADEALAALLERARRRRQRGEVEAAIGLFRSARGSLVASAGVLQLQGDALAEIDAALAQLGAPRPVSGEGLHRSARRAAQHVPLARLLALGGFVLWLAAAFALASLDPHSPRAPRVWCGALLAVGFSCFGMGLWLS